MRFTAIPGCVAALGLATLLSAQTKINGTVQCGKPDEQHMLEVGDRPGHSLMISKGKCAWTKPMEIAGTQTKEDVGTNFDETHGNNDKNNEWGPDTHYGDSILTTRVRLVFTAASADRSATGGDVG